MAAHQKSLIVAALVLCAVSLGAVSHVVSGFPPSLSLRRVSPKLAAIGRAAADSRTLHAQPRFPQRIISLAPSVTEMLFAIGAGPQVVGVGTYDRYPSEALTRTKVGGLIDPDIERIISLKPDLVIVYGTQTDLRTQMERAGISIFLYEHSGMPDITTTIRALGSRVGRSSESAKIANQIEADIEAVTRRVAGRPRPRTMMVFGRDAETLRGIYASGGIGFLHDMLEAAGGSNVFADVKRQSLQVTTELAIARAPEVIVEIGVETASSSRRNLRTWDALASVPAVRSKRLYLLTGDGMMNPGPRISESVRRVAQAIHPDVFK